MKPLLILLFGLISLHSHSQRMTEANIAGFKLHEIYSEFIDDNQYSLAESAQLGKKLAQYDSLHGVKRILLYYGFYSTNCKKCLLSQFGFEGIWFAANDIKIENVDAFASAYNDVMYSQLSKEQHDQFDVLHHSTNPIFHEMLPLLNKLKAKRFNDTLINLMILNDTLEHIFKDDVRHIKIEIADSTDGSPVQELNFIDFKTKGAQINTNLFKGNIIYLSYNFENVPNNYSICWCELLQKKYRISVKIRPK